MGDIMVGSKFTVTGENAFERGVRILIPAA